MTPAAQRDGQADADNRAGATAPKAAGMRKPVLLAVPLLLAGIAALWFTGVLPGLLGARHDARKEAPAETGKPVAPIYVELPDIIANLNGGVHRQSYLKLTARLEVSRQDDVEPVKFAMPRLLDLFQTYLRELRPEELRGSAGTYRLREELISRANLAVAPARVTPPRVIDVLFLQILLQ